ncbi:ninjurin-1-like [Rhagoletis pomonella]|uniref:ninjurin-1-like n=1 Tax=Rhagoletis pomonella TaxID=28610 RepID=UPI001781DD2E|nr:ninjurin-1-like [Rhagoletis pomonella]
MDNRSKVTKKDIAFKVIQLPAAAECISEKSSLQDQHSKEAIDIEGNEGAAETVISVTSGVDKIDGPIGVDSPEIDDQATAPPTNEKLRRIDSMNYAGNKNLAEGLMDIALLSANANQLRFLLTYNDKASTYYMSLCLVGLSLVLQVAVGVGLIFKRHLKRTDSCYFYIKEFLLCGVFIITVVNILLAAFTTTDGTEKA